ncbi:acyl-CoA dehydrogenase family protein [Paenibacillus sp. N1-5-1-14]|uniref:acyl-CoA dehydrogenase family protein n=1 Tax=Paenibacillus radicibacter TaxID=2972488 RepID=UPI00215996B8|nr:acyl-CoA dehydrogenase family protein [Paenibacillus radicibacter]MCR8642513.1 acyl-CoA dehydrogenase family protein [Paenibacillus radicibacter]
MSTWNDRFVRTQEQRDRYDLLTPLVECFAGRASEVDEQNGFSFENITDLKAIGYHALTVPDQYGGAGISLYEVALMQERLAQGDAATALGMGWHIGCVYDLAHSGKWDEAVFARVARDIAANGTLLNRASSEPANGSPTRGGKPETTAIRTNNGWRIHGRKTFTTLSPVLDHIIVSATITDSQEVAEFLIPRETTGIRIDETWNMMGMRGTGSHDLILENVDLPLEALVRRLTPGDGKASPYHLFIPATYLGIALAARREALVFAANYQPNSLTEPIIHLPHIREQIGRIDLALSSARAFMYSVAQRWDTEKCLIPSELAAVKHTATNTAISVVDQAMRIVGAHSLSMNHPLQRMYRDVRFGLHNPPMDDSTIRMLGDLAVKETLAD